MASQASPELPPTLTHNKGTGLLVVGWLECFIASALLLGRLYTRARIRNNTGWDDWTMILAWILAVVTTIIVTIGVHYGVGQHIAEIVAYHPITFPMKALEMTWLTAPFSTFSAGFGKTSVALLLMRLLDPNLPRNILLWFVIVSLFIVNLLVTIITFAQCTPVTFLWERLNPEAKGRCWNPVIQERVGIFQGAYSAATDIGLAIVPIFALWRLQMQLRLKIGVIGVLSLGLVAGAAAIVKTVKLPELSDKDFTWTPVELTYWYLTENWLIIIAGCIPTLRPLVTELVSAYKSRQSRSTSRSASGMSRLNDSSEQPKKRSPDNSRGSTPTLATVGSSSTTRRAGSDSGLLTSSSTVELSTLHRGDGRKRMEDEEACRY